MADYIIKDYDGLKEAVTLLMDGAKLRIDTLTYQNDMATFTSKDDVLSLLIHLGCICNQYQLIKHLLNCCLVKSLISNRNSLHSCFFVLIKIEAEHIPDRQSKVV